MTLANEPPPPEGGRLVRVAEPDLGPLEREYLMEAFDSGWIGSRGPFIDRFETKFADLVGSRFASATSNGTTALHVAIEALDVGPGDEVLVPALTYVATANAVRYSGGTPVFVDVDPETLNPTPEAIEARIGEATVGVMVAHLYGNPALIEEIGAVCDRRGLFLLEDAAQALGAEYRGRSAGAWGDMGTFSFYGNKTMVTGEGGMVVSDDERLIDRVAALKNQGQSKTRRYWHDVVGFNYRMTNLQAAIGLAQVERFSEISGRKKAIFRRLREEIRHPAIRFQRIPDGGEHGSWMTTVFLQEGLEDRCDEVRDELWDRGVETRPVFPPVPLLPPYGADASDYPGALLASRVGFSLPAGPKLEERDLAYVCEQVDETLREMD